MKIFVGSADSVITAYAAPVIMRVTSNTSNKILCKKDSFNLSGTTAGRPSVESTSWMLSLRG